MNVVTVPAVTSLLLLLLSSLSRAAPSDLSKADSDVSGPAGMYEEVGGGPDVAKRLSSFVRIGRPSSFVRIGRASHFVRIGRPGNFVRIGRGYEGDLDSAGYDSEADNYGADKRASRFVRIGKASRFVRIGKSGDVMPEDKRMSSFVRIGRGYPSGDVYTDDDLNKRYSSFVRIGRSASQALLPADATDDAGESEAAKA